MNELDKNKHETIIWWCNKETLYEISTCYSFLRLFIIDIRIFNFLLNRFSYYTFVLKTGLNMATK